MKALSYLNKFFKKYRWKLILGILFIILTNIFNVVNPIIIKDAIGRASALAEKAKGAMNPMELYNEVAILTLIAAGLYLLVYLIKGIFLFFTRMTIIVMSRQIEYDLKNEVYDHYQKLDVGFYKRNNTGDLLNRISEDVSRVRMYLGPAVMYTLNLVALFIICVPVMLYLSPELTLYSLLPLPLMSITIYYVSNIMNKKSERVQRQQSKLSTFVQEAFSGIRVLKAYSREDYSNDQFGKETADYRKFTLEQVRVDALFFPVIILLIGLSTTITIYVGGKMHIADPTSIGYDTIVAFIIYINMLTWPFASVGWVTSLVQRAAASQTRINEFLETEPDIKNPTEEETHFDGNITFDQVHFTYPDSGIEALKDVSFKVKKGETLAIIGRTGSGKSTITQLLCRQYDPSSGSISVDDQPLNEINLTSLRDAMGYVPQDVFLFSDTITRNIAFGIPINDRRKEEIEQAARDAGIYDNIMHFKDGFETRVGERGITLSGGQKQRVSIARAIIKSPEILIFDDCLSAVDTETEELILSNLRRIMRNKTTILISHRVSTVKDAQHIIVLDDGRIKEEGSHQELLELEGAYFDIYRRQLLEEQDSKAS